MMAWRTIAKDGEDRAETDDTNDSVAGMATNTARANQSIIKTISQGRSPLEFRAIDKQRLFDSSKI